MADATTLVVAWLAIASLVGFVAMAFDKAMAMRRRGRVPEKTLLGLAAVGGSLGVGFAIYALRHKSRKRSFLARFWTIVALQALGGAAFLFL